MTWSPQDDVVVVIGSYGPLDDLIETARSLTEVDQATWDAVPVGPADDGCNSMWC